MSQVKPGRWQLGVSGVKGWRLEMMCSKFFCLIFFGGDLKKIGGRRIYDLTYDLTYDSGRHHFWMATNLGVSGNRFRFWFNTFVFQGIS